MDLAQTLVTFIDVCALLWVLVYSGLTLVTFWLIATQSSFSIQMLGRFRWTPPYKKMVPYFLSIAWLIARAVT